MQPLISATFGHIRPHSATFGHTGTCKALIDLGVEINSINRLGFTPLFYAAGTGHEQTYFDLIGWGAILRSNAMERAFLVTQEVDGNRKLPMP